MVSGSWKEPNLNGMVQPMKESNTQSLHSEAHTSTLYRRIEALERDLARLRGEEPEPRHQERRLEAIVEALPVGIGLVRNRVFEWVSGPLLRTLGYTEPEVLGQSTRILYIDDAEFERVGELLYRQLAETGSGELESQVRHKDGSVHDVQVHARVVDPHDLSRGVIVTANDVTEARQALEQVHTLSRVVEQSPAVVMVSDPQGHIEYVNAACERATGYRREELLGREQELLRSDRIPPQVYGDLWRSVCEGKEWRGELHSRRKDGELYWEYAVIAPVLGRDGVLTHVVDTREDITERKAFEERLLRQTNFDPLTGLPNRVLVLDRLHQALAACERSGNDVGVLLVDLDNFKKVSETLGREAGDKVLAAAAQRLGQAVRSDDTVARLGGDEFLLVLPELRDISGIEQVADKILQLFTRPFKLERHRLLITASVGATHARADGRDPQHLIKNAETAMYLAKQAGRNTYRFFTPELNRRAVRRLEMESHLARALEQSELSVHFQPLVTCDGGVPVALEALLRWNNPELGDIPPDEFIPLAEQIGLIRELGTWVLRQAAGRVQQWRERYGLPLRVAVNVSSCQFERGDLLKTVRRVLNESGLPAQALELEITEGLLLRDEPGILDQLLALRKLGVHLAIDDFGTGYSSLSYLKRFPIDSIKIDRSFVRDLVSDTDDAVLVRTIILMGQGLGLAVIAEGVESTEQLAFLNGQNCVMAQGYYFSPPLPPAECADWIERNLGSSA